MKTAIQLTFTLLLFFVFSTGKAQETKTETTSETVTKTEVKQEDKAKQEGAKKKAGKKSSKKEEKKGSSTEKIAINEKGKPAETTKPGQSTTTTPKQEDKSAVKPKPVE